MIAHECNDCHHEWTDAEPIVFEGDWEPISLTGVAITTAQVPTRRTPKPCPHCGSTNTTEKAS